MDIRRMLLLGVGPGAGDINYNARVLATQLTSLIGYLPLTEASGLTAYDASGNARNATYHANCTVGGTTFLDGLPAPLINNGVINWYSTSLRDAFNGAEHTVSGWAKLPAAAWIDGADHYICSFLTATTAHYTRCYKRTTNYWLYAGHSPGTVEALLLNGMDGTAWFHWAVTVSKSNNRCRFYVNGEIVSESDVTGTWSGVLSANGACIGAVNTSGGSSFGAYPIARVGLWAVELSSAEILALYQSVAQVRDMMFIGDSKTAADVWVEQIRMQRRTDYIGYTKVNVAYGIVGATAGTMKTYVDANLATATGNPVDILINLGSNDSATAENTFKTAYRSIIASLKAKWPTAHIYLARPVVLTAAPPSTPTAANAAVRGWINDLIAEDATLTAGIDETGLEGGDSYVTNLTDITHYTAAGELAVTALWKTVLGF